MWILTLSVFTHNFASSALKTSNIIWVVIFVIPLREHESSPCVNSALLASWFAFSFPFFCLLFVWKFPNLNFYCISTLVWASTSVGLASDQKAHVCSGFTLGVFIFTLIFNIYTVIPWIVVLHRYRICGTQMYLFQSEFSIFTFSVRRPHERCQGVYISIPSPAETIALSHYWPVIHEQTLHDPSARAHDAGGQGWLSPSWLVCVGIMVSQMRWCPGWLSLPFPPARRSSVWILVHIREVTKKDWAKARVRSITKE